MVRLLNNRLIKVMVFVFLMSSPLFLETYGNTTQNEYGYSLGFYNNNLWESDLPRPPRPIFWKADLRVDYGSILSFEKKIYQPKDWLWLDWGISLGSWGVYEKKNHYDEENIY